MGINLFPNLCVFNTLKHTGYYISQTALKFLNIYILPTQWNSVFCTIIRGGEKKQQQFPGKSLTDCFCNGQALLLGVSWGLSSYSIQTNNTLKGLVLNILKKRRINETWQQNVSKNKQYVTKTYKETNSRQTTNWRYSYVLWKMLHVLLWTMSKTCAVT